MELMTCKNIKITQERAYRSVLEYKFARGFRLSSSIELRRFRRFFLEINQCNFIDSDEEIIKMIKTLGLEYEGKILYWDTLINKELLIDIKCFI